MNPIFDSDLYRILGVSPNASREEISAARTRLLKRYHPDKGGDTDSEADREHWTAATAEVNAAWDVLRDADKRRAYDAYRQTQARAGDNPADPSAQTDRSDEPEDRGTTSREAADSAPAPPPPPRKRAPWPAPAQTGIAVLAILAAVFIEGYSQDHQVTYEQHAAGAERAAADVRRALAILSVAEGHARDAEAARKETSAEFWAATFDLRKKQLGLTAAMANPIDLAPILPPWVAERAGGASAALAGAVSWLFSKIPWDLAQVAADWAKSVRDAAEEWAREMERRADARRLNRQLRIGQMATLVEIARTARETTRAIRDQAASVANRAERKAKDARHNLTATQSAADQANGLAVEAEGDAARTRTYANAAWIGVFLATGWAGIRRLDLLKSAA